MGGFTSKRSTSIVITEDLSNLASGVTWPTITPAQLAAINRINRQQRVGNLIKTILRTGADFVPLVGSGLDIYEGVRDGNGWQVAGGVGFLAADVLTLGGASVLKGSIKVAGGLLIRKGLKNAARTGNTALKKILPSYKRINIDIGHIVSGHTKIGSRALQSGKKTVFGDLSNDQVQRLVRNAYKNVSKKLHTQGDRVKVRGSSGGYTIDMWINRATNTIETAYPISF